MSHDAERDAALFMGGAMDGSQRERFSTHLLECGRCWSEVEQARYGRSLAEAARTSAPAALRDRVRGLVAAEADAEDTPVPRPSRRPVRRWLLPTGVSVAAAAAVALILSVGNGGTTDPPSLREAVADYTAQQLPGSQLPGLRAPDLSRLQLQPVGAGGGTYAGLAVDGYAYEDVAGRRVMLYLSDRPFPEAPGAQRLAGADGPWLAQRGAVVLLCARLPHALLVLGADEDLVRSTASALGVL